MGAASGDSPDVELMVEERRAAGCRRQAACVPQRQGRIGGDHTGLQLCRVAGRAVRQAHLLIDLNLPLGDAALNLGVKSMYSTVTRLRMPAGSMRIFSPSLLVTAQLRLIGSVRPQRNDPHPALR